MKEVFWTRRTEEDDWELWWTEDCDDFVGLMREQCGDLILVWNPNKYR